MEIEYDDWEVRLIRDGEQVDTQRLATYLEVDAYVLTARVLRGRDQDHRWRVEVYSGDDLMFNWSLTRDG